MGKRLTHPKMGTIIHCWDHIYKDWRPAIVTKERGETRHIFYAVMFRGFDSLEWSFYFNRENCADLGGWRLKENA
jgi:hypothetical protein